MIKLDNQQNKVLKCKDKKIIVIAGAGSGKTRLLTAKVEKALKDGVKPCNIICITFTNMAAEEMRQRLAYIDRIGDAFIGTIHSFANKIYKASGYSYQILTDEKEIELSKECIEDRKKYKSLTMERLMKYYDINSLFEAGEIDQKDVENFLLPSEKYEWEHLLKPQIHNICKDRNILTFDELLEKTTKYFHEINGKVEHLFVDEFQDIGILEWKFIQGLKAENEFFVGDDWQSIYSFKGGCVGIFKSLCHDNDYKQFYLENNYRNTKLIKEAAEIVINQVRNKIDKKIKIKNKSSYGEVIIKTQHDLEQILKNTLGKEFKDWFILTRTNKEVFEIGKKLKDLKIPYITFKKRNLNFKELQKVLKENCIKLLTVHSAKGLENKNVLLYGKFPLEVPPFIRNQEERKVMYVGMTRAKEKLIIAN